MLLSFILICTHNQSFSQESNTKDTTENKIAYYKLFLSKTLDKGVGKSNMLYFQSHISSERFIKNISIEFGDFKKKTEFKWTKIEYPAWSDKPIVLELTDELCNGEDHCISFSLRELKGDDLLDPSRDNYLEIFDHFEKKIARSYFRTLVFF